MPATHNDLSNEQLTRPLSKSIHSLINARRLESSLEPFEWDLSLYYLALSVAKAVSKHLAHPSAHAFPTKKCIGIPYKFSYAHTRVDEDRAVETLFSALRSAYWALDGYIFTAVAGYTRKGVVTIVNVVAKGAVIPMAQCPLCRCGPHFSASNAAAVFGRLSVPPERRVGTTSIEGAGEHSATGTVSSTGTPSGMTTINVSNSTISGSSSASVVPGAQAGSSTSDGSAAWNVQAYAGWGEVPQWYACPWYGWRAYQYS